MDGCVQYEKESVFWMKLEGYKVLNERFEFEPLDVEFDEKITSLSESEDRNKGYIIPGFVDVHTHGAIGQDFMNFSNTEEYIYYMYSNGITTFYPTTICAPIDTLCEAVSVYKDMEVIEGVHIEGPFINVKYKGAHNEQYIYEAYTEALYKLQEASGGKVKIITVAPEVGQNMEFIAKAAEMGIHVSLGHTDCDFATACSAIDAGADHITHLYNAMPPLHHRKSGLVGAAFDKDVFVEIIGDGFHVAPEVVRLTYKAIGDDRLLLISDSMEATGLSDGEYMLGGIMKVNVVDGMAYVESGAIAGSTHNIYQMVKSVNRMGIPIESAVKMATYTPAKSVGISDKGIISEGKCADLVVLDNNFDVVQTIKNGKTVFSVC